MKGCLLLATVMLTVGCSQQKQGDQPVAEAPTKYFKVDPASAATLRGDVRFAGKPSAAKRISMDAEEACQTLHDKPVLDEQVLVGKNAGLANAFVYIKTGLEGKAFAPATEAVVLDQRGCQFVPRVVALRVRQILTIKNSDPVSHNIHPMPKNNRDWHQQQSPQGPDLKRRFGYSEVMIPVKCNVHAWMKSYIGVLDHPFFAVTGPSGEFVLEGLPPGEYTVAAWHEVFGETTQTVAVREGEAAKASFVLR